MRGTACGSCSCSSGVTQFALRSCARASPDFRKSARLASPRLASPRLALNAQGPSNGATHSLTLLPRSAPPRTSCLLPILTRIDCMSRWSRDHSVQCTNTSLISSVLLACAEQFGQLFDSSRVVTRCRSLTARLDSTRHRSLVSDELIMMSMRQSCVLYSEVDQQ